MTSIDDLAREVGVSTATVSRALRGLPRVSAATRSRVEEAAVRLGYVPSASASGLATGRTRTVAVVVPFVTRWFFGTVVHGAEQVLRERGYDLLLYNLAGDPAARHRVFGTGLLTKRADAVLVLGLTPTPDEVLLLHRGGRPVGLVGASVEGWPSVRIDDRAAARSAVQHLLDLGHRRIGYVGGLGESPVDSAVPTSRRDGYRATLADAGLEADPALEVDGMFTMTGGLAAGRHLLASPSRPTAVFAASDEMAIGVLRAAREAGLAVPGDLSVIGIDDHEAAPFFDLSTVRQQVDEQGRTAARQVLARLGEAPADGPAEVPTEVVLPTELVLRATTAPPARRRTPQRSE
ncbi:LacI family DNA-binding transcriptional regulator [Nocardioides marmotae]|uniref:LacI family DNA-binding transcriptional regulator n=1 Tax=Nocardioides marmotae TaxID=2663857 RepID=A0A6I3JAE7_9ACTN|nr:LacI family DNA-binding transcriptional regulator [Nocardioides marmotae]MCR6030529.1 LacI family DNA-binding transcriptional regulator [Gordonia jinghuaiqii]MBC9734913.1 LacI family DNA-binding transcriptional regulator [Nocardioides marmotae]MTB86012.1 LacI family DNA-binding transcriptional regulator [Nocardioides marmotae]MTB94165.1 LacI family DNA-binding transcriptional regulator [Nocardioides marmotae]QKE00460.1 LacI family DNA-binding transcriptional regulator [Nocardioides marmotae